MTYSPSIITVLLAATATFSTIGIRTAAAQSCTGPFESCATAIQATCSIDRSGRQRMSYYDPSGSNTIVLQRCVGGIFQAAGHPNPYTTGVATYGNLMVPETELLTAPPGR
jgi:hypothetical protein